MTSWDVYDVYLPQLLATVRVGIIMYTDPILSNYSE